MLSRDARCPSITGQHSVLGDVWAEGTSSLLRTGKPDVMIIYAYYLVVIIATQSLGPQTGNWFFIHSPSHVVPRRSFLLRGVDNTSVYHHHHHPPPTITPENQMSRQLSPALPDSAPMKLPMLPLSSLNLSVYLGTGMCTYTLFIHST